MKCFFLRTPPSRLCQCKTLAGSPWYDTAIEAALAVAVHLHASNFLSLFKWGLFLVFQKRSTTHFWAIVSWIIQTGESSISLHSDGAFWHTINPLHTFSAVISFQLLWQLWPSSVSVRFPNVDAFHTLLRGSPRYDRERWSSTTTFSLTSTENWISWNRKACLAHCFFCRQHLSKRN